MIQVAPDVDRQTKTATPRLRMSYEEFLRWAPESRQVEWVDGEVIEFMPAKMVHQIVQRFLSGLLNDFLGWHKLGQVLSAPFEMRARADGPAREPDILFVANDHLARLTADRLVGPADLIVEIVSDDSVRRDRVEKFREYREAGVPEYWIIDPRPGKLRADFYKLDSGSEYVLFATEDDPRVDSHVVPGFWIKPDWLWQAATLNPMRIVFEILGMAPPQAAQDQGASGGEQDPGA